MIVLGLDVSTKTGWALFDNEVLIKYGTVYPKQTTKDFGPYPHNYTAYCRSQSNIIISAIKAELGDYFSKIDTIVIEETNTSRQNYSQKLLEFMHFCLIEILTELKIAMVYVRTGEWRKLVEAKMTKEEKSLNAKIARIKKKTSKKLAKIDGKVVGKKTRKHVAIRRVEEIFGIDLRGEDDTADAILLALGYIRGAPACDGTVTGGKS